MNFMRCSTYEKPQEFKGQYLSNNKIIQKYVELSKNNITNINTKYDKYKDYMYCKYKDTLCKYAIDYKKIEVLKWALNNDFNYSYTDCQIAIKKNFPDALNAILVKNNIKDKKLLEKASAKRQGIKNLSNETLNTLSSEIKTSLNNYIKKSSETSHLNNEEKNNLCKIVDKIVDKNLPNNNY